MAELVNVKLALTDEDYRNFEQIFSGEIPPSFRAPYISFNGGHPAEEDVEADRWGLPVQGFNPIKYGTLPTEELIENMGPSSRKTTNSVPGRPVLTCPSRMTRGVTHCFFPLRDSDYGCVYIYAPDGGAIKRVAMSFEAFRERLYRANSA